MKFDIANYKGQYAMHCKTARESREFCDYLDGLGKTWKSRETYAMATNWSVFKSETCYCFNDGMISRLSCCKRDGYIILEWSDFVTKFTKGDLRDGMVVELANGNRYLVLGENFINKIGYLCISDYSDGLDMNTEPYNWNVNKVYKSSAYSTDFIFKDEYLTLIWERPQKTTPIEMTLEEVCRELGREIKIIK